jgi:ATP-dependent exoDNAse (exonuclease V) beta subunit
MKNLFDNDITLIEPEHKYILESDPNFEFKSVTEVAAEYFEPFDKLAIATKLVTTNVKYSGMEVDELIQNWDEARDYGTKVHGEIESFINDGISPDTDEAAVAINWLDKYKMKSHIEIFSEVRVYSKELKLAGSIDIVAYDKKSETFEIIDWKTAKTISTTSFDGKMGTHSITNHLMDCKFVHYSMQLSLYRYLIEKFYGLKVNNQLIAQINKFTCVAHVADYYRKEVIDIINDQNN